MKPSPTRSRAIKNVLRKEGRRAAAPEALARQARTTAKRRGRKARQEAARKAVRTKGSSELRQAARKAARTRARKR